MSPAAAADLTAVAAGALVGALALLLRPRSARRVSPAGDRRPSRPRAGWPVRSGWPGRSWRRRVPAGAVATWLDAVARAVRSGESMRRSLSVVPGHPRLAELHRSVRRRLEHGDTVAEVLERWRADLDDTAHVAPVRLAADVLRVTAEVGGSHADPVERLAATLRSHEALALERRAQSAPARLSAIVLTVLPLAVFTLLLVTDADVRAVAVSPLGALLVAVGLGLDAVGGWWMHRIIERSAR